MWKRLLKKNIIPYTITTLVILFDYAVVLMLTLWEPGFSLSILSTSTFWLTQTTKTVVSLIAYFAFIYFSSVILDQSRQMEMTRYKVNANYEFVSLYSLIDARDVYINIQNNIKKATAYLTSLDIKVRKIKDYPLNEKKQLKADNARAKINIERNLVINFIKHKKSLLEKTNKPCQNMENETIEDITNNENKFNINSIYDIPYTRIEKRLLDGSNVNNSGKIVGYFNKLSHISIDTAYKLVPSFLLTMLMSIIIPGKFSNNPAAVQSALMLGFVVLINCLFGWCEGVSLTKRNHSALNEIKEFYSEFFTYGIKLNIINDEELHKELTKIDAEIKAKFPEPIIKK